MKTKDNGAEALPPLPAIGPPQIVDPAGDMSAEQTERLQKMLGGQIQAPNEFAEYLVQQLRETMARGQQLAQKLSSHRRQVKTLEEEGLRLEGVADQHLRDLAKWDKPIAPSMETPASPSKGEKDEAAT